MVSPNQQYDEAAVTLLDNLHLWRLRAIERVELSQAFWSVREREIHVQPLKEVMWREPRMRKGVLRLAKGEKGVALSAAEVVLPISEFPKIPLLDLEITVNGKHVSRLSRDESARVQAHHILRLAERIGGLRKPSPALVNLLAFIFFFPQSPWQKVWSTHKYHWERIARGGSYRFHVAREMPYVQLDYLKSKNAQFEGFESFEGFDVRDHYAKWRECVRDIPRLAAGRVITDPLSGSQHPLISLPYYYHEMRLRVANGIARAAEVPTASEMTALLEELRELLFGAAREASRGRAAHPDARRLLAAYFTYGYRWMAMARCRVPLAESFTINVKAKLAIYFTPYAGKGHSVFDRARPKAWQMVPFSDAETNHVSIRVSDTVVRFGTLEIYDESLKIVGGDVEEEEGGFELYFRQDSEPEESRDERIYIKSPLRLTWAQSLMLYLSIIVTGLGIGLLLHHGLGSLELTVKGATLVLVPTSFVASFLLIRDTSTLSSWLRRPLQLLLLAELFILLVTAFTLLWSGNYTHDPR
ncbi:hypothetical protein [Streptomyces sioyaensis]|uniref:hypothetical protein n=1 Tax=Streptomyces sioyaensis TaxID=67364 RepID=UPI003D7204E4